MASEVHDLTAHTPHDHAPCVDDALDRARLLCEQRGTRLTALRQRVLALVWASHRPQGAYAILGAMADEGQRVAPLTVYRALDFLVANGLVHRVESLNAYVGCPEPGRPHSGQFLVCTRCGNAAELTDKRINRAIAESAGAVGFQVQTQTVEVRGLCPACQAQPAPAAS